MYIIVEDQGDIRLGSEDVMSPEAMRAAVGGKTAVATGRETAGRRLAVVTAEHSSRRHQHRNLLASLAAHRLGLLPDEQFLTGTAVFAAARGDKLLPLNAEETAAFGIILGIMGARTAEETADQEKRPA